MIIDALYEMKLYAKYVSNNNMTKKIDFFVVEHGEISLVNDIISYFSHNDIVIDNDCYSVSVDSRDLVSDVLKRALDMMVKDYPSLHINELELSKKYNIL